MEELQHTRNEKDNESEWKIINPETTYICNECIQVTKGEAIKILIQPLGQLKTKTGKIKA